jgi:hypothetical protein
MTTKKPGDAHNLYDYDHSPDDVHDESGYLAARYANHTRWQRLVFAAAFLIPFGVLALGLAAASYFDDDGADTPTTVQAKRPPPSAVEGQWPAGVTFAANTVPAMIRNEIAYTGEQHGYQFKGRAGDVWRITVEPENGFDPQIRLYEPSGGELAYNDDQVAGSLTAELLVILPSDGTYRLLVEAAAKGNGVTGTYWLSVFEE